MESSFESIVNARESGMITASSRITGDNADMQSYCNCRRPR